MQRAACLGTGEDCSVYDEQIASREIMRARRQYDDIIRCPPDYVEICTDLMRGCGNRHKSISDEFSCITRDQLRRAFQ